jgi:Methyltransferase domain
MSDVQRVLDTTEGSLVTGSVQNRIDQLDTALFEGIPSQTSIDDRRSLLAIHAAVADLRGSFAYLEIGSHLGGSIQPYLLDERCTAVVSIDKRPAEQPDMRGNVYKYPGNSTDRMLQNLRRISDEGVRKVRTFDADTSQLRPSEISVRPDICFIDGEHTNLAVERDFAFCLSVVQDRGVIFFHDSNIVFEGLSRIVEGLKASGRRFRAYNLPTHVFVVDLGERLQEDRRIIQLLVDNYLGYLPGLESMSSYRDFYNDWPSQKIRVLSQSRPVRECSHFFRRLLRK